MANRNAARHLLLVVSVLLCFFVYMGYRLRGSGEPADQPAASRSADMASLTASDASRSGGQTRLMTMDGSASGEKAAVRSPIATPSARPPSMSAGENIPDAAASTRPTQAGEMPLASSPGGRSAPSGSIEESAARPAAVGEITGLVPAPPVNSPSANAPAANVRGESVTSSSMPAPPGGGQASSAPQAAPSAPVPAPATASVRAAEATPPRPAAATTSGMVPPPPSAPAPAPRTESARQAATPPVPVRQERVAPPESAGPVPRREAETTQSESLRLYVVRPGDTLSRIAVRELGSISLADNIFLLNRDVIADPNHLFAGMRIRLPVRDVGVSDAPPSRVGETAWAPPERAGGTERVRVHTVARGETLSSISLRYYGSSSGWRTIHEANRNVIENPNRLAVGAELVIPPLGETR